MKILLTLILFTILTACLRNKRAKEYVPHPKAKQLFDSAARFFNHPGSEEKAIDLFHQATQIDSNYYEAYFYEKKLQLKLNLLNDALMTTKNLIRLKPEDYETYMSAGFLYWRIGDSLSAIDHFTKASVLIDKTIDKMSSNSSKEWMLMNKGVNLILMGEQEQGNKILRDLFDTTKLRETKKELEPYLNKSRKKIIEELFNPDTTTSEAGPIIED